LLVKFGEKRDNLIKKVLKKGGNIRDDLVLKEILTKKEEVFKNKLNTIRIA
jgi:CHAD domain-containing protein